MYVVALLGWISIAHGQAIPKAPRGEMIAYHAESGTVSNSAATQVIAFSELIRIPGASWIRVHFSELDLSGSSSIRIVSQLDGEVQELEADGAAAWSNASAYFNGDSVRVELLAAPRTISNRLVVDRVEVEFFTAVEEAEEGASGQCGICGVDDRVPSNQNWSARLMPGGCTASVFNMCSCLVSAGHCATPGMVVQFNVPNSLSNCGLVNPPVADQFPIVAYQYSYVDIGNDWSVLKAGANNLGQKPYDRYGQFRPIATTLAQPGASIGIWAFGMDSNCINNQRQQHSSGIVNVVAPTTIQFSADLRGGASGTGVIHNGTIVGVATNCTSGCPNVATAVSVPAFVSARATLCPCSAATLPCPADLTGDLRVNIDDLVVIVSAWGPCPIAPLVCTADCEAPSGIVDINDLMAVINGWGLCQ
jgi:hypothetical protein